MAPIRLSHTWSRRLYVGLFLLSLVYIGLYSMRTFSSVTVPEALHINGIVAGVAACIGISSAVLFILVKKISTFWPTLVMYALFALTTAYTVQQTGGVQSFFLGLWTLAVFFAPVFGAYGWVSIVAVTGVYAGGVYLHGGLSVQTISLIAMSSLLPLLAGMLIWRETAGTEDASEKNVKNLANQLSEVATKSEIVINAIGDGVIAVDGKGTIQLINPAAQTILGWGKQDALMLSYRSIFKLADEKNNELSVEQDPVQQVLNTNQQTRINNLVAITQTGKRISISLVISPIGEAGSGAIAVFRDITNERAAEREQAEFISTASHEMRTPVASIEGYLGLALNPATATIDAKARDFILKAHEAAQHLGRLFQDLLDVTKSEDGRMTNTPRVVDLVTYTQTIVQGLTQKATDKGLQLIFEPSAENDSQRKIMPIYYVNQDNDHIREILDNLIENAIKYTPKGKVVVDMSASDDKVVVSIKDSGLGIPPEDLPHLFQKFYRINNVDRQSIGGTGLGLFLVRRLTEALQGRVWVESVFKEGSTFFVELPRVDTQEAIHLKEQQDRQVAEAAKVAQAQPTEPAIDPNAQPVFGPVAAAQPASEIPAATLTPTQAPPTAPPAPAPTAAPATTVPRGESLTREQIAERVRQLEAMARQQRSTPQVPTERK
jgi:PAS domain S-box-containing protein